MFLMTLPNGRGVPETVLEEHRVLFHVEDSAGEPVVGASIRLNDGLYSNNGNGTTSLGNSYINLPYGVYNITITGDSVDDYEAIIEVNSTRVDIVI